MLGSGEVVIHLAGAPVTLRPLLGAAVALNRHHGGLGHLMGKLEGYDLAAATDVVLHGLGRHEDRRGETTEQVFGAGLVALTPLLIRFVIMLANGGRPLKEEEAKSEEERPFV